MEQVNLFEIAQAQLNKAAKILNLDPEMHAILNEPYREIHVTLQIKMDDGVVKAFKGFRVQYNDARGPFKGGIRFHPSETHPVPLLLPLKIQVLSLEDYPQAAGPFVT